MFIFVAILGVLGGVNYARPVGSNATIIYTLHHPLETRATVAQNNCGPAPYCVYCIGHLLDFSFQSQNRQKRSGDHIVLRIALKCVLQFGRAIYGISDLPSLKKSRQTYVVRLRSALRKRTT